MTFIGLLSYEYILVPPFKLKYVSIGCKRKEII